MLECNEYMSVVSREHEMPLPGSIQGAGSSEPALVPYDCALAIFQDDDAVDEKAKNRTHLEAKRVDLLTHEDPSDLPAIETAERVSSVVSPVLFSRREAASSAPPVLFPEDETSAAVEEGFTERGSAFSESRSSAFSATSTRWDEFVRSHSEVRSDLKGHRGLSASRLAKRAASAPALLLKEAPSVAALAMAKKSSLSDAQEEKLQNLLGKIAEAKSLHQAYNLVKKAVHFLEKELSHSPMRQAHYLNEIIDTLLFQTLSSVPHPTSTLNDNLEFQIGTFREKMALRLEHAKRKFWDNKLGFGTKLMKMMEDLRVEIEILKRQEAILLPESALHTSAQDLGKSLGLDDLKNVFTPYRQRIDFSKPELKTLTLNEILNAVELVSEPTWAAPSSPGFTPELNPGCILDFGTGELQSSTRYVLEVIEDAQTKETKVSVRPYAEAENPILSKSKYFEKRASKLELFDDPRFD